MTYGAFAQDFASEDFDDSGRVALGRKPIPQAALCAVALALSTSVGLWALYARPLSAPQETPAMVAQQTAPIPQGETPSSPAEVARTATLPKVAVPLRVAQSAAKPAPQVAPAHFSNLHDPTLLYPSLTTGYIAGTIAQSTPLGASFALLAPPAVVKATAPVVVAAVAPTATPDLPAALEEPTPVRDVPLPLPRPSTLSETPKVPPLAGGRRTVATATETGQPAAPAPATPAAPGFFEKMFGGARPQGTALAYATPEDGVLGGVFGGAAPRGAGAYDRYTAIYDITNHTVHMPDGTRLEAHSGLGPYKDNPAGVALRMVGATPPNLYQLTFREAPFHGVRALRLTPLGGTTFGRAGLLAHTYMLRGRPPGESNGCVVFADYDRFLRAYESGAIRKLAVVARM